MSLTNLLFWRVLLCTLATPVVDPFAVILLAICRPRPQSSYVPFFSPIPKINNFINSFKLTLTHIHPNNYGATDPSGNPTVIELTFEKNPPEISGNPG